VSGVKTTCPYCGVGCGIVGEAGEGRALKIAGDEEHPANFGRLCSKGAALASTVGLEGRLLHPEINGRRVSWAKAIRHVARGFARTIDRHGPDSVAFYVSGQLLTEDYYAANKLMKGFIGSGNIDTNSRLCMASAVAAHVQAFGADLVPGCYEDLELADLVVFAGHNAAWTHPVLARRMEGARAARGQHWIAIDPRRTDTAELCDLHLALRPQTDVRLWNGLLAWLEARSALDPDFLRARVSGADETLAALARDDQSLDAVAADCDLQPSDLLAFYEAFAATPRAVTLFSQGSNQSAQGVAKALAVINAHLATGKIGKPGAAPFSVTGQPNAMGGREVGGMATTLAAHMPFTPETCARLARFWGSTQVAAAPGLKAVDMFEAVGDGRIKAIWVMATNPVVSLPDAGSVAKALAGCPLVVVSEAMAATDTAAFAHVKLPALAWGEKDGTVTNSERRISRQRPLFAPPGEARADWRIVADVACAMGFADAFGWKTPGDVFREHARLTAFENGGTRPLSLAALAAPAPQKYELMAPVQWPPKSAAEGTARLFEDGVFATPDGRARMVPVRQTPLARPATPAFPLLLNTGRVRDHWHTLTRTGLAPELCRHAPEPVVDIHPDDAAAAGLKRGTLTRLVTPFGEAVAPARLTEAQRRGEVFLPMHWTAQFAPAGRAGPLIGPERDPVSGQPQFKTTPARLSAYRETWRGFLIDRRGHSAPVGLDLIWRRVPQSDCHLHEFAGRGDAAERQALAKAFPPAAGCEVLSLDDVSGAVRRASLKGGRLQSVLCLAPIPLRLPPREWLIQRFADMALGAGDRRFLLAGWAPDAVDEGPTVCACRTVGRRTIERAIEGGAADVDAIGAATGAGVTCGSCRPELGRMLSAAAIKAPAIHKVLEPLS
jgi:assimilatory nitrate reductase catalytic subunit